MSEPRRKIHECIRFLVASTPRAHPTVKVAEEAKSNCMNMSVP